MPPRRGQALIDRLLVVAVLRLVVTRRGRLLYGEAIDAETEQARRFSGWQGLDPAIRGLVDRATAQAVGDVEPAEQPHRAPSISLGEVE